MKRITVNSADGRTRFSKVLGRAFGWTVALLIGLPIGVLVGQIPNLEALQGKRRVLLVFAGYSADPRLARQREMTVGEQAGLEERDVSVYELTGNAAGDLRARMGVQKGQFAVVLVGKDGSRKLKRSEPLEMRELFRTIDAMPMRKREITAQKESSH